MTLVSVIIPTYNRASTIKAAANSVLQQTVREIELIIVDDCSNDNTEAVISSIADPRISYYRNDRNEGAAKSRNIGAARAQGKYLAFHDSDDIWRTDKLEKQLQYLKEYPEAKMVYCAFNLHRGEQIQKIPNSGLALEGSIFDTLLQGNTVGTPTIMVNRQYFREIGGFDESILALEDWEFALRISQNGWIGYLDECLVDAYSDAGGVNSNRKNLIHAQIVIMQKYAVKKKDLFRSNLLFLMESIADEMGSDSLYQYKEDFVPLVFSTDFEFYLCCDSVNKVLKFKRNYNLLANLLESDKIEEKLELIFQKKQWKHIALYGAGKIGKIAAGLIIRTDVSLEYLIDNHIKSCDFGTIRPIDSLDDQIDAVIITVKEGYQQIASEIEKRYSGAICYIGDLL